MRGLLVILVIGLLGFLLLAGSSGWWGFSLERKLDPIDLATLAVTALIAFFLQDYFTAKATESRAEKETLIVGVRAVIDKLRSCQDTVSAYHGVQAVPPEAQKAILVSLRRLANELDNVETVLAVSNCKGLSENVNSLKLEYFSFKMSATGGEFPKKAYTPLQMTDQKRSYRKLYTELHELVFAINRHAIG